MADQKSAQAERRQNRSFSSSLKLSTVSLPDSITLGSHNIPFSDSARNLGFILGSNLSMKKYVIKICQATYFELKRLSSIRRFLTEDAPKTLFTSHILSRLDYCNCLLMGTLILSFNLSKKFKVSNLVLPSQPLRLYQGKENSKSCC